MDFKIMTRLGIFALIAVLAVSLVSLSIAFADSSVSNRNTINILHERNRLVVSSNNYVSHVGPLVIENSLYLIQNSTFVQTGDVIVTGTGRLELKNSVFILNQSRPLEFMFVVEDDGALSANNSEVLSNYTVNLEFGQDSSMECYDTIVEHIAISIQNNAILSAISCNLYQVKIHNNGAVEMSDSWITHLKVDGYGTANINHSFCEGIILDDLSSVNLTDGVAGFIWTNGLSKTSLQCSNVQDIQTREHSELLATDSTIREVTISTNSSVTFSRIDAQKLSISGTSQVTIVDSSFIDCWCSGLSATSLFRVECSNIHTSEQSTIECKTVNLSYLTIDDTSAVNLLWVTCATTDIWNEATMVMEGCEFDTLRIRDSGIANLLTTVVYNVDLTDNSALWSNTSQIFSTVLQDESMFSALGTTINDLQALGDALVTFDKSSIESAALDCANCIVSNSWIEDAIVYSPIQITNSTLGTLKVRSTEAQLFDCTIKGLASEYGGNTTALRCVLEAGYSRQTSILNLHNCELTWLLFAFEDAKCLVFDSDICGIEVRGNSQTVLDNTDIGWRGILLRNNDTVIITNDFTNSGSFTIWETSRINRCFLTRVTFENGTSVVNTPIVILLGISEVLSGTTDTKGEFAFKMSYDLYNISSILQQYNITLVDFSDMNQLFTYEQYNLTFVVSVPLYFGHSEPLEGPENEEHESLDWIDVVSWLNYWFVNQDKGMPVIILVLGPSAIGVLILYRWRRVNRLKQENCEHER